MDTYLTYRSTCYISLCTMHLMFGKVLVLSNSLYERSLIRGVVGDGRETFPPLPDCVITHAPMRRTIGCVWMGDLRPVSSHAELWIVDSFLLSWTTLYIYCMIPCMLIKLKVVPQKKKVTPANFLKDPFHIAGVLRSGCHHSWVSFYMVYGNYNKSIFWVPICSKSKRINQR